MTHLVTMKKPDTMAFFGFKKKPSWIDDGDDAGHLSDVGKKESYTLDEETQRETWPDERSFEDAERQEREDEIEELETLSQELEKRRHHGKEIVPNPKRKATNLEGEWWDCPICLRPQSPDEKEINQHIDRCLSMQTIREAVQETATPPPSRDHGVVKKMKTGKSGEKMSRDPKQRRLTFG